MDVIYKKLFLIFIFILEIQNYFQTLYFLNGDWGLGIGDWGLGIGD